MAKGRYIATADITARFGVTNVTRWATLDNDDASEVEARLQLAIDNSEDGFDDEFRDGRYTIPFPGPPRKVIDLVAKMAGIFLYQLRGFDDKVDEDDPEAGIMSATKKQVEKEMDLYKMGTRKFDTPPPDTSPEIPVGIGQGLRHQHRVNPDS